LGAVSLAKPAGVLGATSKKKIRLGFDNFSIRAFGYKAPRLIEYASELKVDTLLLSDLDVYESLEKDYLQKVRSQAKRAGVELQAGTGSICPTSKSYNEKKWGKAEDHARLLIRAARRLGASVARCYLGSRRDREGDGGIYRHMEEMVKILKAVRSEAEDANVKIAIENHAGDMQAWELVELIEEAGKSFVGATMDPGNATWTLEDPMVNLEILGPYVLTAGIRDTAVWETDNGATCMWANMGHGVVDWPAYVKLFEELCPQAPFVLEIISYKWSADMDYLKPEFWAKFPKARAHEFARFVAMAKRGSKFQIPPGRPSGANSKELEQAQQKFDLEESLKYCREKLGLGLKSS
ncbi:MAG: sugar phosphate isomerase/epimerase family protein, partial [Planctomycetota bacterium]